MMTNFNPKKRETNFLLTTTYYQTNLIFRFYVPYNLFFTAILFIQVYRRFWENKKN